jgi:hypothetical protein
MSSLVKLFRLSSTDSDSLATRGTELVFLDDYRVHRQAGLEADFIKRAQIGRVGDGNCQAVAALVQWHDAMAGDQLAVNRALLICVSSKADRSSKG